MHANIAPARNHLLSAEQVGFPSWLHSGPLLSTGPGSNSDGAPRLPSLSFMWFTESSLSTAAGWRYTLRRLYTGTSLLGNAMRDYYQVARRSMSGKGAVSPAKELTTTKGQSHGGSTRAVESAVVESSYIQPASTGLTMPAAACLSRRRDSRQ